MNTPKSLPMLALAGSLLASGCAEKNTNLEALAECVGNPVAEMPIGNIYDEGLEFLRAEVDRRLQDGMCQNDPNCLQEANGVVDFGTVVRAWNAAVDANCCCGYVDGDALTRVAVTEPFELVAADPCTGVIYEDYFAALGRAVGRVSGE